MNPACRLIVALDVPVDDAFDLVRQLRYQANNYKLGIGAFLQPRGRELALTITGDMRAGLMLDLKLYDTRDTVLRTMETVAKLGATMVTVHADCVAHAVGFGPKVLAVSRLTDKGGLKPFPQSAKRADGFVCPSLAARWHREDMGQSKIIVCPGIRPIGAEPHNHVGTSTPGDAIRSGADYIVVGRPIYAAPDPVEAARAITREIAEAGTMQPGSPG